MQSNEQTFILKFFPEIMIKGESTRKKMITQLHNNINNILRNISKEIRTRRFLDKIEVYVDDQYAHQTLEKLQDIPGIDQILKSLSFHPITTLNEIKTLVHEHMRHEIKQKRFKVRAKRSGNHPFNSPDIEKTVGGYLLAHNETKGVDLHNPEVTLHVHLVQHQLNIITQRYQGLGGFPLGTQGEVLSLMSGGFDSTVASYLMMKRGIKTHFIFFNLGGIAHEIGVKQVALYLWSKFGSSHRISFTTIPFEGVVETILTTIHETYMGVILKRLMVQAASTIAQQHKIDSLVTGESIAQVSSQTLRNLALIDQATPTMILRPLITMNKPDIINIASEIGTRHFAETMPEYCGVISKNPVTHGSYERVEKEANAFDQTILEEAINQAKTIPVDQMVNHIQTIAPIEVVTQPPSHNQTIIDIREHRHGDTLPKDVLTIPFYHLKTQFPQLPQDREYLFYCEKGILSQLHAQYLRDQYQYHNIKVYRP